MATATEEINENVDFRACLSDLTKIPEKEFERQFRSWMERDEVARELQSKLRCDLITNFNKTTLGKRLIAETTTNRMTLSPMKLALNTLVAEFLYAQNCHFTLSVFCTEVPFRNTLPDFESIRNFRFQKAEIFEIMNAICGNSITDWNINNKVAKHYAANTSTSLLYFIIEGLLEKSAESMQKKVTIGTNTRPMTITAEDQNTPCSAPVQQTNHNTKTDMYNLHFRHLNKYLIVLSKKVKEMSDQFEHLQKQKECFSGRQPRVRILKSARLRKYEDLNRSLERVTENLKQMANAKRKSKHVDAIVKAIETLASQFEKCATNFETVSHDLKFTPQSSRTRITKTDKSTSAESLHPTIRPMTASIPAVSQTDLEEKSYADWVHEMRYTRNGQRFLDRVEKSLRKAIDKQKQELMLENEIRLRHQSELLKIRYKQKLIEQMYFHGGEQAQSSDDRQDLKESISEHFRQFEMKHFDLLNKIYESENESKVVSSQNLQKQKTNIAASETLSTHNQQAEQSRSAIEKEPLDKKLIPSTECSDQQQHVRQTGLPENSMDLQQYMREAIDEMCEEERNVNQIVFDAKLRIRELEQENNQLTEHFLGYLERQRQQKLDARDAAQCLWNDYVNEPDKMKERCVAPCYSEMERSKELENIRNEILNSPSFDVPKEKETDKTYNNSKTSSLSSNSTTNSRFVNPILKAKEDFFERQRKFKEEAERVFNQFPDLNSNNTSIFTTELFNRNTRNNEAIPLESRETIHERAKFPKKSQGLLRGSAIAHFLNDTVSGTGNNFSTLWTTCPQTTTTTTSDTVTAATATATRTTDEQNNNLIFTLTSERPQNVSVNKSQRREMFSTITTTTTASTALTGPRKQIAIPTTTTTVQATINTIPTIATKTTTKTTTTATLNKNNDNIEGHSFGANFVESLQATNLHYDYKIKSDYGQKELQQSESNNNTNSYTSSNNNNKYNNNNNSNNKLKTLPQNTEESSKNSVRNETATRKAVLQQSMARMQQLFSPHQEQQQNEQQQQQHSQAQIILDDITKEFDEEKDEEQQTNKKKTIEEGHKRSSNQTTKIVASSNRSENVFSHYKNNLQLQQATAIIEQQRQQQQLKEQQQTPSTEYIGGGDSISDGNAITITANIRKQQNTITTTTSSNGGNKAIEALPDWQQIGHVAMSEKIAFHGKEETAKGTNEVEEVVIEKMNVDSNVVESGEVIKDESLVAVGISSTYKKPEALQQPEVGELIENAGATGTSNNFTTISSQSSIESSSELQLSVGGGAGGGAGDGARLVRKSLSKRNSAHEIGSDSGSDFWA